MQTVKQDFEPIQSFLLGTGLLLQSLCILVDTAIVGRLGYEALGALGTGGLIIGCLTALLSGLSTSVQSEVARHRSTKTLELGLWFAMCFGIVFSIILISLSPFFLSWILPRGPILELTSSYLSLRGMALLPFALNSVLAGYCLGTGQTWKWFTALISSLGAALFTEVILVMGFNGLPNLGMTGVGVASLVSSVAALISYFILGIRFDLRSVLSLTRLNSNTFLGKKSLLATAIAGGGHQFFFSLGLIIFLWRVGKFGTQALSVVTVLMDILVFAMVPIVGVGMMVLTSMSQAAGTAEMIKISNCLKSYLTKAVLASLLVASPLILVPEKIISIFIQSHEVIELTIFPLRIFGLLLPLDAIGIVVMNALYAVGKGARVAKSNIGLEWIFFLPLIFWMSYQSDPKLSRLWIITFSWRILQNLAYIGLWSHFRNHGNDSRNPPASLWNRLES